jgi:sulfopyruvate decarboxylase subunit alpha
VFTVSEKGSSSPLTGAAIIEAVKEAGVEFVAALPDIVTCDNVLWPMTEEAGLRVIPVCKEEEGISICAGLSYCNRRAVLLIQHTGFLAAINAVRAIAVEYELPIFMIVGLQGMEPDRNPRQSDSFGIRIMQPILETMGIGYDVLTSGADVAALAPAIEQAYTEEGPHVVLVASRPV